MITTKQLEQELNLIRTVFPWSEVFREEDLIHFRDDLHLSLDYDSSIINILQTIQHWKDDAENLEDPEEYARYRG